MICLGVRLHIPESAGRRFPLMGRHPSFYSTSRRERATRRTVIQRESDISYFPAHSEMGDEPTVRDPGWCTPPVRRTTRHPRRGAGYWCFYPPRSSHWGALSGLSFAPIRSKNLSDFLLSLLPSPGSADRDIVGSPSQIRGIARRKLAEGGLCLAF